MAERTIDELCEQLLAKRKAAEEGGGKKAIDKQHEKGKLTARERIERLLDPGSFVEIDEFVEHRCSNFGLEKTKFLGDGVVTGYGTVDGRIVYVFSQDFTVMGGSLGEMHARKICKVLDLALQNGCPVIGINDSGGARIQEAVDALSGYGSIFFRNVKASGVVPQISVIAGPCAGGAVYSPALTDFIFMVDKIGIMHITGPAVIKAVTGEDVTSEQIGGAMAHNTTSGVAQFFASNEDECFAQVRKLLSYLPSNNMEEAPIGDESDDPMRMEMSLREAVPTNPNKGYDVRDVIRKVVDHGDFFEVQPLWARNIVTGFARIGGRVIGVIANQANYMAGCLDIDASDKASRHIRICDAYNIPIVTFEDVPGYLPGLNQEMGGIIRHGAKLLYAYSEATAPKITVVLRKAYGGSYLGMCSKDLGADVVLAWPQAEIAVMGAEGAANIIFRKEIDAAEDKAAMRAQKIEEYREAFANPYQAASRGFVDRVILPEETRGAIYQALVMCDGKRELRPKRKHGIMPH
ncbi:carboxyl transferase [Thermanaerovibrio acidaminovorans DSM 6589]|jgi:acetyl-CoA carboxylase carboxyltransferase component|uniref:Carboxyl transferase n=1 Tax=Thermanaerovibrio acidaminovorans (strain ATCC 49978 / DSM 6589 / Su883) TaxID=525903 RepID=D1B8C5_THEAS|nr:acyl-CoA carboxylase subunit beta [Thermanaerovibrio acidaminovorans]ACZ18528.1 carboxyl transferase [Thermanaerovibrio acidaminovorans DSM 6589]